MHRRRTEVYSGGGDCSMADLSVGGRVEDMWLLLGLFESLIACSCSPRNGSMRNICLAVRSADSAASAENGRVADGEWESRRDFASCLGVFGFRQISHESSAS
jgi:hypothetical protein